MAIKLTSTNLTKNLVRRTKLVHHLDRAFDDWDETFTFTYEPKEKDDAFHPSGDCTPSVVDLYYKALDHLADIDHDPISTSLRKTFLVGHFWHQVLQHHLVRLGFADEDAIERHGVRGWGEQTPIEMDRVFRWYPFHWARGSADVAPCRIPRHGDWLVDFKTMKSMDFNRNWAPDWAVRKWECQVNIYMDWFDLEKALIVGINKDSPHDFKEFEFIRNQPLIDAIYHKWEIVSECLDENDPPHEGEDIALSLQGPVEQ